MKNHSLYYQIQILRYRKGDDRAFESIWLSMEQLVHKQIYGITQAHIANPAFGEDIMQECRMAVYRAVCGWKPSENPNFLTYAMQAVRNAVYNAIHCEFRHIDLYTNMYCVNEDGDEQLAEEVAKTSSWINCADAAILCDELETITNKRLSGSLWMMYHLSMSGCTPRQLATKFGITLGECRGQLRKLRKELELIFQEYNEGLI